MSDNVAEIEPLIDGWLTVPDVAERLSEPVTKVRAQIREGKLIAVRRGDPPTLQVPAAFIGDGILLKGLPGLLTVLRDQGYTDDQALRWLFTPDDTLPGSPVQALLENRGTEVKRRAMTLGF
ncbi:MAG: Rv2175c family DNA-binding protein [Actinomycetota bacterium]|nr:Rv2175c family DNA-binding protein [Actinomycetota bacterium]